MSKVDEFLFNFRACIVLLDFFHGYLDFIRKLAKRESMFMLIANNCENAELTMQKVHS